MKELFLILFFSKLILVTPTPIDLEVGTTLIKLEQPISAITSGASVQIDLSTSIKLDLNDGVMEAQKKVRELLPPRSITATLKSSGALSVQFTFDGGFLFSKDKVLVSMHNMEGVPTGVKFEVLVINSSVALKDVSIYWRNYNL